MALNKKSRKSGRTESPDNDTAGVPHASGAATRDAQEPARQTPVFEDAQSPDPSLSGRPAPAAIPADAAAGIAPPALGAGATGTHVEFPGVAATGTSMLDPAALQVQPAAAGAEVALDKMALADLLVLRGKIDKLLPPHTLAEMDLESELLLQYQLARELMTDALSKGHQVNHQATVVNTCQAILAAVIKSQAELHNSERVKAIELALERWFKARPMEEREAFFAVYASAVRELAGREKVRARREVR